MSNWYCARIDRLIREFWILDTSTTLSAGFGFWICGLTNLEVNPKSSIHNSNDGCYLDRQNTNLGLYLLRAHQANNIPVMPNLLASNTQ
jgi:hypothetical protein